MKQNGIGLFTQLTLELKVALKLKKVSGYKSIRKLVICSSRWGKDKHCDEVINSC